MYTHSSVEYGLRVSGEILIRLKGETAVVLNQKIIKKKPRTECDDSILIFFFPSSWSSVV